VNKYQENNSKVYNLSAHISLVAFAKSIIHSLTANYFYYKTGSLTPENLVRVLTKFDDYYSITETSLDRTRRHELNQVTVQIKLLRVNHECIFYVLMARKGKKGNSKHLFFERETFSDARKKQHRIKLDNYQLVRVNKPGYEFEKEQDIIPVLPKNGVWTLQITDEYKRTLLRNFNDALQLRNWNNIRQICYKLSGLVPFSGVRQDYVAIRKEFMRTYKKFAAADKVLSKQLHDFYNLPEKLPILSRTRNNEIEVSELLQSINFENSILNQRKKLMANLANLK